MKGAMKALVWTAKETLVTEQREIPTPAPGEALIKVKYAGICGSDLSIYNGKHPRATPPLIMGHEFSGVIVEINPLEATDFKVGDRVVPEPLIPCGKCFACKSGLSYVCQYLGLYGIDEEGAFAEYVKIPIRLLYMIPENLAFDVAALIEPFAVTVHAVRRSSIRLGDTVCVLGGGPIGLLTALVARLSGPERVVVCELQPYRVRLAREFGIEVIDTSQADPVEEINRITDGRGADVVFEAAGAEQTALLAPRLCRVHGEIIIISMPKVPRLMDFVAITFREATIKGTKVYAPYDFQRAIQIMATSDIDMRKFISPPYTLEEGEAAFQAAIEARDVMKVIFKLE